MFRGYGNRERRFVGEPTCVALRREQGLHKNGHSREWITLGLLESKVGDGTYVKAAGPGAYINELVSLGLHPQDQIEIMEFRKALETEALKLAAERATDEDLAELEAIHVRAREAHKKKDVETYFKEDLQFHTQIFKMSKNRIFTTAIQTLGDVLFPHFYTTARVFFETFQVPSDKEDNTVILEALKRRGADLRAGLHQTRSGVGCHVSRVAAEGHR